MSGSHSGGGGGGGDQGMKTITVRLGGVVTWILGAPGWRSRLNL